MKKTELSWRFKGLLAGMVGLLAALVIAPPALANGGHIHFGGSTTGIPIWAAWLVAGVGGLFAALFLVMWLRFSLAHRRSPTDDEPNPEQDTDVVYPDVSQRHVTQAEDPDLREAAREGPDTTTRIQKDKDKESHEPQPRS